MELNLDLNKKYTFADYLTWFDDKRRELWGGFIKMMTPAPLSEHQKIIFNLSGEFYLYKRKNQSKCGFFEAPFDVRFPKLDKKDDKDIDTVVQPDIVIVCDKSKLDKYGCIGAPDFIAEIISPSTAKRDMDDKYKLYEQHGVKEYWIVFPREQFINAFYLENGKYVLTGVFTRENTIPVKIFDNKLEIDLKDIFEEDDS
ncbi:MAG: Uma2 family endonuclease [Bacteroidales bacterium]|nr:Uma2 family endonuclease [Bacteroidales bacterium]